MKVFIVSDMEGVAGIVKWQQTDGAKEKRAYHEGRELYTEEINAAVRGAKAAGGTEIVVMDCHGAGEEWTFNSLIPDKLDPDCEFVVQNDWTEYTEFLEQGVDAALFVGMHAKVGTPDGVMGINAALCGHWNCPVLLVTGDDAVCRESRALLGDGLTTVAVKTGIGQFSARQFPALKAREMIEDGAKNALKDLGAVKPYDPGHPCEIEVQFHTPARLVEYRNRKGTEQVDDHTLVSRADDWWTAWSQFYF
jgi:D-amino peptidase